MWCMLLVKESAEWHKEGRNLELQPNPRVEDINGTALEVKPEEEAYVDKKRRYFLHGAVYKIIKEMRDKDAKGDNDIPGDILS